MVVALFAALAWTGSAMADAGLVDQYTEQVPTASGPKSTGGGGGGGGSTYSAPLSSSVQAQLQEQGGKDAKTLEQVATSSRYGAPREAGGDHRVLPAESSPGAPSAAVNVVTDGMDGRLIALFVALAVVAAMMLGAAASRRGRRTV